MSHSVIQPWSVQEEYGNRALFPPLARKSISGAIEQLKGAVLGGRNLQEFFHEWMEALGNARHGVSVKVGEKNAALFGRRRDSEREDFDDFSYTVFYREGDLSNLYNKCNKQIITRLGEFSKMILNNKLIHHDRFGCESSFSLEILNREAISTKKWNVKPLSEVRAFFQKQGKEFLERSKVENLQAIHNACPELYERDLMCEYISMSKETSLQLDPDEKLELFHLLGTAYLKVEEKVYPLSRYLTWGYFDPERHPSDRMVERSKVLVIHTPLLQIKENLQLIARLFERAMLWKKEGHIPADLIGRVALLRYAFAHVMPFLRGGGSIGEWMEEAIYRCHGFEEFRFNDTVELEAFGCLTFGEFLRKYRSIVGELTC